MKLREIDAGEATNLVNGAIAHFTTGKQFTWEEFEEYMGADIRPAREDKASNAWKGYVQNRNMLRGMVNGLAEELKPKKAVFKVCTVYEEGDYFLKILQSDELAQNLLDHHSTRVTNAPINMAKALGKIEKQVSLTSPMKKKMINAVTVAKIGVAGMTKLIETLNNDPEAKKGDFPKAELQRLVYQAVEDMEDEDGS